MSLSYLWEHSRQQLEGKHIQQIIAFAGDGHLRDNGEASVEFRSFLRGVPSALLQHYADQCLKDSFNGSGFALQDIVNEIGRRLGFEITSGRYRGVSGKIGFDGLWRLPEGHTIVVETKTTDAYRIDLNTIAEYRKILVKEGDISENESSILIVVGRKDTGDMEAQIRGSRHAWDIRLISVDALNRLMDVKQEVEDPQIIKRINDILIPREFTKLDEIVDILFSTTEDIKGEQLTDEETENEIHVPKFKPVSFNDACVKVIESYLNVSFVKQSRASYLSSDNNTALICTVSKEYLSGEQTRYWFAFHPHQKEFLEKAEDGYVAFGCGSENNIVLIPIDDFSKWLDAFNITRREDRFYWHIHISSEGSSLVLQLKQGASPIDLDKYRLSLAKNENH
jgi:hypothetical protein